MEYRLFKPGERVLFTTGDYDDYRVVYNAEVTGIFEILQQWQAFTLTPEMERVNLCFPWSYASEFIEFLEKQGFVKIDTEVTEYLII